MALDAQMFIESITQMFTSASQVEDLVSKSMELSKLFDGKEQSLLSKPTFAPKRTLRGLIQRWRDRLAQLYDEGD